MNTEELHRTWCIRNDIKIYPIRLLTASESYKIGITTNTLSEKIGDHIYLLDTNKTTIGVYDKIKEMQQYFYDLNNQPTVGHIVANNVGQQQPTVANKHQQLPTKSPTKSPTMLTNKHQQ